MAHPAVDIRNLTHRYGDHEALRDVTLEVPQGRLFGLLGPNGGGKTTLFRILSTLIHPTEGEARVFGHHTVDEPGAVRKSLGVVFQQPALDDELTLTESLRYHAALYGLRGAEARSRIATLLDTFGLAARTGDRIRTLSGGLQRRADLARGLLHRPPLILLDEPTTGLDPAARHAFWEALDLLRRDEGTTLFVATHLMEEAERCDEVAIIDHGRLVVHGPPEQLRGELGDETLWLQTPSPRPLADRIHAQFGVACTVVGSRVQVAHPEAHTLLSSLYEAFGDQVTSATVRRPTLEDVFLIHTGNPLDEQTPALAE